MKRLCNFFLVFLVSFCFIGVINVNAKVLGTIYANNADRGGNYTTRLNLFEEFSNNSPLSDFLLRHSLDLSNYLKDISSSMFNESFYSNAYVSLFSTVDLENLNKKDSSDYALYHKCENLGCSYAFLLSSSITYDGYWFEFDTQISGSQGAVIFYDYDMNPLGVSRISGTYRYNYWIETPGGKADYDFTSLLNIFLFRSPNANNSNNFVDFTYSGGDLILDNLYYNNTLYSLSNTSGRNAIGRWWHNLWNKDEKDLNLSDYSLIKNEYLTKAILKFGYFNYGSDPTLYFLSTSLELGGEQNVPDDFKQVDVSLQKDGFYLVPTLDSSCKLEMDYAIYYYTDIARWDNLYYSVLDKSMNIIGHSYFISSKSYAISGFTLINEELNNTSFSNIDDRIFYFHQAESVSSFFLYYNPTCLNLVKADSSKDVSFNGINFDSSLTSSLKKTEGSSYYYSDGISPTTWKDIDSAHGWDSETGTYDPTYGSNSVNGFNISDILKSGYEGISGLFTSISSILGLVTVFLTSLPAPVYSVLLTGFTCAVVVLILKMFL